MRIFVSVKPGAKETVVERLGENQFSVKVKEPPVEGKANKAVIKALSKYLDIPASRISVKSGESGKRKVIDISEK